MSDDQFTKLFKYIQEFRSDVNDRFDAQHNDIADLRGAVAESSAHVRDYNESILLFHQVDKLREAIKQIA
jgi:hypothetical protein